MWMKQFINTITQISSVIKNNAIFDILFYVSIFIGLVFMFLFSSSESVNFIYNQF